MTAFLMLMPTIIPRLAEKETIGILGLGQLGVDAARKSVALGFKVSGWRRSDHPLKDIPTFSGPEQLNTFLAQSHILINMLPSSPRSWRTTGVSKPGAKCCIRQTGLGGIRSRCRWHRGPWPST